MEEFPIRKKPALQWHGVDFRGFKSQTVRLRQVRSCPPDRRTRPPDGICAALRLHTLGWRLLHQHVNSWSFLKPTQYKGLAVNLNNVKTVSLCFFFSFLFFFQLRHQLTLILVSPRNDTCNNKCPMI